MFHMQKVMILLRVYVYMMLCVSQDCPNPNPPPLLQDKYEHYILRVLQMLGCPITPAIAEYVSKMSAKRNEQAFKVKTKESRFKKNIHK